MALAACGGGGGVPPERLLKPIVTLDRVTVRSVGLSGGTLDLTVGVENPNPMDLWGLRLRTGLDIDRVRFGDAVLTDAFSLPAQGKSQVTLPLQFEWLTVGPAAHGILSHGSLDYGLNGTIKVRTPSNHDISLPFERQGSVPLVRPGGF
jgi:LEA14-like dessication related protein